MLVFLQITNVGADAGPFILTANNGGTVIPNTLTKAQLIAGFNVTVTNNNSTIITITSTGLCTNSIPVIINLLPDPTTTTTTII